MSVKAPSGYLSNLSNRLGTGLGQLPQRFRRRQWQYILGTQNPDGGFSGRQGASDLYYTSFALRSADLLCGEGSEGLWSRTAGGLSQRKVLAGDVTDCFSLLHIRHLVESHGHQVCQKNAEAEVLRSIETLLQSSLTSEGGYANSPSGEASLYHTFLAALSYQLLGHALPKPKAALDFVRSRQGADGGFVKLPTAAISTQSQGGTNPTAAAVAVLSMFDVLDKDVVLKASDFLKVMQVSDGGFKAHPSAPVSDLMSTFTALVTLAEIGTIRQVKLSAVARFVREQAMPAGGLRSCRLDEEADVEYTYYGLGVLGLLGYEKARARGEVQRCTWNNTLNGKCDCEVADQVNEADSLSCGCQR